MSGESARPDITAVLGDLKNFQRLTVDRAFERLFTASDSSRRFLVADEVGLGKTRVAKGVIARTIDHLWDSGQPINIVYVCSNADIARQNISRLRVTTKQGFNDATRLTLLPLRVSGLNHHRVNLVSFTPGTSFDLGRRTGTTLERALIYRMLHEPWKLRARGGPVTVMRVNASESAFRYELAQLADRERYPAGIDAELCRRFVTSLDANVGGDAPSLREQFDNVCHRFRREGTNGTESDRAARNQIVGELRRQLARSCIGALKPSLVILDEFQRFRELLTGESEAADLARALFEHADATALTRVLLLSATPYKHYSVRDEGGEADHYEDFVRTIEFLQADALETARVRDHLVGLRRAIFAGPAARAGIAAQRDQVEAALKRVMARTERSCILASGDSVLDVPASDVSLTVADVKAYLGLQRTLQGIAEGDTVEFWKSAPFLMSFMEGEQYQVKRQFAAALGTEERDDTLVRAFRRELRAKTPLALTKTAVQANEALEVPHARMRWLMGQLEEAAVWRMLWIAPSLPYYQLEEAYAGQASQLFTKRLVFSAWRVAPKSIAGMVSHEIERRMLDGHRRPSEGLQEQIDRTRPLLTFRLAQRSPAGMSVLTMLYPSLTLAECGRHSRIDEPLRSLPDVLAEVEARVQDALRPILEQAEYSDAPDERWYWAAPVLMDHHRHRDATAQWLDRPDLALHWHGEVNEGDDGDDGDGEHSDGGFTGWASHVKLLSRIHDPLRARPLGRPPADLAEVLALIAVASPAVCALRTLSAVAGSSAMAMSPAVRDAAGAIAFGFRSLFNLPEVSSSLRSAADRSPYWLTVLRYCASGGLQAVLDEYVHVVAEDAPLSEDGETVDIPDIAKRMCDALNVRTSTLQFDGYALADNGRLQRDNGHLRQRFAMRYGDSQESESAANRKERVLAAFNSPFWPFVLATTSVGQEGLDFHRYCHAVVHWNLPSNPVDLEQREGRVNRYKGHAVRRNVALRHRHQLNRSGDADPWTALFARAVAERPSGASDLVPFWTYPMDGGAAIERHVPNLPMSRDVIRLARLRQSLAVYRMVFGQARQEDLVEYLMAQQGGEHEIPFDDLRIDLSP